MTEEEGKTDSNLDDSSMVLDKQNFDDDNEKNGLSNVKKEKILTDNDDDIKPESLASKSNEPSTDQNGDIDETRGDNGDNPVDDENNLKQQKTIEENVDDNAVDIPLDSDKSKGKLPKEEVENDPNFAIICSFLENFGQHLEIKYSIKALKNMFEDFSKVRQDLIDLHLKLMKKRRKYINKEKWEKALMKFCCEYSNIDAWELERFGYKNAKLSLRLRIIVRLLESMFDFNPKFKSEINTTFDAANLRVPPYGRDITGYTYWYQIDSDLNFRLYKGELDEDGSWFLASRNLPELEDCIEKLQQQTVDTLRSTSTPNSEESNSNQQKLDEEHDDADERKIKKEEIEDDDEEDERVEEKNDNLNDQKLVPSPAVLCDEQKSPKVKIEDEADDNDQDQETKSNSIATNLSKVEEVEMESLPDSGDKDEENFPLEISSFMEDMIEIVQSESGQDEEKNIECKPLLSQVESENETTTKAPKKPTPKKGRRKGRGRGKKRKPPVRKTDENSQKDKQETGSEVVPDSQTVQETEEATSKSQTNQASDEEEPSSKQEKAKAAGRKRRSELEKLKEDFADSLTAKRYSRRIQALQEKKAQELEKEQKRLEKELQEKRRKKEAAMAAKAAAELAASLACDSSDEESSDHEQSKKSRRRKKKAESDDDYQKASDDDEQNDKKRKKRKRGKGKRGRNPWEDSEDSEEGKIPEDDFDDYIDDDHEELKFDDDNEDEFACEEFDPTAEPVVIRRARTVKKSKDDFNENDLEPCVNDDKPCGKCGKYDQPQWILLCDKCDEGYHTSCLRPPLFLIPTGDWFCPPCEHKQLIEKLQIEYKRLSDEFERRTLERQKQNKRWKFAHCEISAENILETDGVKAENDTENNELEKASVKDVKPKVDRKRVKRRPNGFKDELEEALERYSSSDDENDISDGRSESESEQNSSEDSDESSIDELAERVYSDEELRPRKKHSKKERHIDINDYSRSGLKLRSARRHRPISYLFKEYDDLIKSAIFEEEEDPMAEDPVDEEEEEPNGLPRGKGKDMENIIRANADLPDPFGDKTVATLDTEKCGNDDESKDQEDEHHSKDEGDDDNDDDDEIVSRRKKSQKKQQKKKKLTNLDFSDDEEEDHASDEDFHMADDDDEMDEELTEVEEDDDNGDDDDVTESDSDLRVSARRRSSRIHRHYSSSSRHGSKKSKHKKHKSSNSRSSKKKFIIDSDEEEEDDEGSSDELMDRSYSDESSDYAPRSRRAAVKKRVSYREASSTEDEAEEKYQDDDDYECDDYDEEVQEKKSAPKEKFDNPKLKVSIANYSEEYRSKKRAHEDENAEDQESSFDKIKKAKIDDTESGKIEEKPAASTKSVDKISEKNEPVPSTVEPVSEPAKVSEKSNDQTDSSKEPYLPPAPDAFPKTVDPLDSIKQMNSKFDEYNATVPKPVAAPPATAVPPPPAPTYPPPGSGVHYPRPPSYQPVSNPPYTNLPPYNPSQPPPNHQNYPLPAQQTPHQYLPRPPSGAYPPPPHSGQFHPSQPIRPAGIPPHSAYSTAYPAPPARYPVPPTNAEPPTSRPTEKPEEGYTLTNLDSFGSRKSAPNYHPVPGYGPEPPGPPPPLNDGQSQILNLDAGNNSFRNYPSTPPKTGPPPPPPYYGYERPPPPRGPVPPDYYSSHQPGFYPGPPGGPPMHPPTLQRMPPPHPTAGPYPPPPGPNQPVVSPPSHYSARNLSPGHQPPPPVPYSLGNNLPPPPTTTNNPSGTIRPPLAPPTTSGYYSYPPYPPAALQYPAAASNGAFMIHNLLHNRPPVPSPAAAGTKPQACATKSAPKATKSAPKSKKTANPPAGGDLPTVSDPPVPKPKASRPKKTKTSQPPGGSSGGPSEAAAKI